MEQELSQGRFREELFYRLNVVNVHLPPLRERTEDIPLLAHYFLKTLSERYKKSLDSFSPDVLRVFLHHSWPGNVRELQNVIERAMLVTNGTSIEIQDLPESLVVNSYPSPSLKTVRHEAALNVEKPFLIDLLRRHQGNVSAAASEARVPRKAIYRMVKKFGINIASFRKP